jgi:hypothetical protein
MEVEDLPKPVGWNVNAMILHELPAKNSKFCCETDDHFSLSKCTTK